MLAARPRDQASGVRQVRRRFPRVARAHRRGPRGRFDDAELAARADAVLAVQPTAQRPARRRHHARARAAPQRPRQEPAADDRAVLVSLRGDQRADAERVR